MYEVIPKNTATANYRRIYFTLVDATDLKTPEDIVVTGVKAQLSFNGAAMAASTNDIVKVSGTYGVYYIELTQTESNTALGVVRGSIQPTGCALEQLQATIVTEDNFAAALTASQIAQQVFKEDISALAGAAAKSLFNFMLSGGLPLERVVHSGGTISVYANDGTTVVYTVTVTGTPTVTELNRV